MKIGICDLKMNVWQTLPLKRIARDRNLSVSSMNSSCRKRRPIAADEKPRS